nr:F101 [uncultured bacterium]
MTQNMERFASDVYPALKTLFDLGYGNEDDIESESAARETVQKQLDKKLDEGMTDGLLVSFVGLSWTALGILLDVLAPHVLGR